MLDINNNVTLQWGRGWFPTSSQNNAVAFSITLPISVTTTNVSTINAGVGNSGWYFMNGVYVSQRSTSTFGGYHVLGGGGSKPYTWVCMGY